MFNTLRIAASRSQLARVVLSNAAGVRTTRTAVRFTAPFGTVTPVTPGTDMFCYQCEQTQDGTGCTTVGVCGKLPTTAAIQDAIVFVVKGIGQWAELARANGATEAELKAANEFTLDALFSTLTNVNFDDEALTKFVNEGLAIRAETQRVAESKGASVAALEGLLPPGLENPATWVPSHGSSAADIAEEAKGLMGVEHRREVFGEDVAGLQELIVYGLKGAAAYGHHALRAGAGQELIDGNVSKEIHSALAAVGRGESDVNTLVGTVLGVGGTNLTVLKALDGIHTSKYGDPTPTMINHAPTAGKCILVSGHDLHDLEALLKQTEGTGINVYTHGEMLPAHTYPGFKEKYPHLVGQYGGPWQLQKFEFSKFPGPIVMTTNCLVEPRKKYKENLFTCGPTGWPGCKKVDPVTNDFSEVIAKALEMPGFEETKEPTTTLHGFGHKTVLSVADKVIQAATEGDLKRIVLIGGCDGTEVERSYYTALGTSLPDEALVLTLGCNKYRLIGKRDWGTIPNTEIPRLLDMGQCNDSYSAVVVAVELAKALDTDVNSLPLSIVLSWFEQKAVAVLLSLLHLGVRDIRVGPNLPAFVTPTVLGVLQDNFNLMPIHGDDVPLAQQVEDVMKM